MNNIFITTRLASELFIMALTADFAMIFTRLVEVDIKLTAGHSL